MESCKSGVVYKKKRRRRQQKGAMETKTSIIVGNGHVQKVKVESQSRQ